MLIKLNNVTKKYESGQDYVYALDKVNLVLNKEEVTLIVGPSGSGKSTLLNVIGGISKPNEGEVNIDDKNISKFGNIRLSKYRRNMVGFIFQSYNLIPNLSVVDNIKIACWANKKKPEVNKYLEMVNLMDRRNFFPHQLSGGQKQRVAIARALAKKPKILLCDEPTGALDQANSKKIIELLCDLAKQGIAVIIVTHNLELCKSADRIIKMQDGRVINDEAQSQKKTKATFAGMGFDFTRF